MESLKLHTLPLDTKNHVTKKRAPITNPQIIQQHLDQNQSCILWAPHYANWDYLSSLASYFKGHITYVYKSAHNSLANEIIGDFRKTYGMALLETSQLPRTIARSKREPNHKAQVYILLSDQRPSGSQASIECQFLGRNASFLLGPEKLARSFEFPIIYACMMPKDQLTYSIELIPIDYSNNDTYGGATIKAIHIMEQQVKECPEAWLWIHDLWKHNTIHDGEIKMEPINEIKDK